MRNRRPLAIHVIGGFLGSGKTTLVERLCRAAIARGGAPYVVDNEVASLDVDGPVLGELLGPALAGESILGGCACCELGADLRQVLERAVASGRSGPLIVESSGLASLDQLSSVVDAFIARDRRAVRGAVVAVLDAARFPRSVARWRGAESHLGHADFVVVNRVDEASTENLEATLDVTRRSAPRALVLVTSHALVPSHEILAFRGAGRLPENLASEDSAAGYRAESVVLEEPVVLARLERLLERYAGSLARAKALVAVPDDPRPHEVQWVPGSFQVRVHEGEVEQGYLVAIGRRVPWGRFLESLPDVLHAPPENRPVLADA